MGHASSEAALRYQHATADRDRVIAASLSELARAERSARAGAVAERLGATEIATLDRRHFSIVRAAHVGAFRLLP